MVIMVIWNLKKKSSIHSSFFIYLVLKFQTKKSLAKNLQLWSTKSTNITSAPPKKNKMPQHFFVWWIFEHQMWRDLFVPSKPLGTCPMVASPCGSSRVVLRTTSPHRAASPVTTATASASASSMAALSPVRARVRLPERSPMKARVLEARPKRNHGNWQTYCFQMFPSIWKDPFFFFNVHFWKHLDGLFCVMLGERGQEICAKEGGSQEGHGGGRKWSWAFFAFSVDRKDCSHESL